MNAALLVLPGWDDKGRHQYEALRADLLGWTCRRADLPDCDWPAASRAAVNREQTLHQAIRDHDALRAELDHPHAPLAALGFSYGGYMATLLAGVRHVDWLILRSPALYPDEDWLVAKEELDKRELDDYRREVHASHTNQALQCCAGFDGHVLLVHSECDSVIPKQVIESYAQAFGSARSVTRHTILDADHQLSDTRAQREYHHLAVRWLQRQRATVY